jgi:dTDP-4-amino-4,6-dideoxygalactose transaminase
MKVPLFDLGAQLAAIRPELDTAVRGVFDEGAFILREGVQRFETSFASYTNRSACIGVNSGTSALHLALIAAGVQPGDEVVTTPYTWISTSWAISYCGARPVFADLDPRTGNLDPAAAEAVITDRTRALLVVDLYGHPADLLAFEKLATARDLPLVEDAAQAHGARLQGRPAGSFGLLSCFSFYPGKNLGAAGEGGAVLTDDADLAERMRRLRDHAQNERHQHLEIGFNYRMEGIQGAVLHVKLPHLDAWNNARRRCAARYAELLADVPEVELPKTMIGAEPVWHQYVVRVSARDRVRTRLAELGVQTAVHYPRPIHLQPAYASLRYKRGDFPVAESFSKRCLSLPIFPEIREEQLQHVATALRTAVRDCR